MQQVWMDIGTWFATVVVSAGAIGGGFWLLLQKALDTRITQILEKHKAELAAQLHAKNTVYSRVDEQRAVAVQKINSLIRKHRWKLMVFSPKISFKASDQNITARGDAMMWCLAMLDSSNEVLETILDESMLLPESLETKIISGWYLLAKDFATELIPVFATLTHTDKFKSATESERRDLMSKIYYAAFPEQRNGLARVTNSILEDLHAIFLTHGAMPPTSPIAPPDARWAKKSDDFAA